MAPATRRSHRGPATVRGRALRRRRPWSQRAACRMPCHGGCGLLTACSNNHEQRSRWAGGCSTASRADLPAPARFPHRAASSANGSSPPAGRDRRSSKRFPPLTESAWHKPGHARRQARRCGDVPTGCGGDGGPAHAGAGAGAGDDRGAQDADHRLGDQPRRRTGSKTVTWAAAKVRRRRGRQPGAVGSRRQPVDEPVQHHVRFVRGGR
jgi:hypothetical protein